MIKACTTDVLEDFIDEYTMSLVQITCGILTQITCSLEICYSLYYIDGFSRLVTFLKCNDNNTSKTILDCFLSGVEKYGIPNKVRSDKGLENVSVADFMLNQNGQNSMITGKSTRNQRIERLWRDVFEGVLSFFYNLFYFMEDQGFLDPLNFYPHNFFTLCFLVGNK